MIDRIFAYCTYDNRLNFSYREFMALPFGKIQFFFDWVADALKKAEQQLNG